jgi:hypothetical protein
MVEGDSFLGRQDFRGRQGFEERQLHAVFEAVRDTPAATT